VKEDNDSVNTEKPVYTDEEYQEKFLALHYALQGELQRKGHVCRVNTYKENNPRMMNSKVIEILLQNGYNEQYRIYQPHNGEVFWEKL